jgi:hypothetical protein
VFAEPFGAPAQHLRRRVLDQRQVARVERDGVELDVEHVELVAAKCVDPNAFARRAALEERREAFARSFQTVERDKRVARRKAGALG